jgi:hypothetical protein
MWRMFVALAAAHCLIICAGDVKDAHAHAPGPTKPTHVRWDDARIEWWFAKTGERVSKDEVSEILCATQGHPEAGNAWERFITSVPHLIGFRSTTHKKNVHQMSCKDSIVLLAQQVDDFTLACIDDNTSRGPMALIDKHIRLPSEAVIPVEFQGIITSCIKSNLIDCFMLAKY